MTITTIKELNNFEPNRLIGQTETRKVPFKDVLEFANLLGDKQWIHIDENLCKKQSPFQAPIVHGYLILGLIPNIVNQLLQIKDAETRINYGLNNVRFPQALKIDETFKVRLVFLSSFNKQNKSGSRFKIIFEQLDDAKPFCIAELLYIWMK